MSRYVAGVLSQCLAHGWTLTNALSFCLPLLPSLQIGFPLSNACTPLLFSVVLTTQLGFTLSCFCWWEEASITVSAKTAGLRSRIWVPILVQPFTGWVTYKIYLNACWASVFLLANYLLAKYLGNQISTLYSPYEIKWLNEWNIPSPGLTRYLFPSSRNM